MSLSLFVIWSRGRRNPWQRWTGAGGASAVVGAVMEPRVGADVVIFLQVRSAAVLSALGSVGSGRVSFGGPTSRRRRAVEGAETLAKKEPDVVEVTGDPRGAADDADAGDLEWQFVGHVKAFQSAYYVSYSKGTGLRPHLHRLLCHRSHAQCKGLPRPCIGFAVFMVHLATIPITGTGINPARSLGSAVIYNESKAWNDHWIFWVGPFFSAAIAAAYHQFVLRAGAVKAFRSYRSNV